LITTAYPAGDAQGREDNLFFFGADALLTMFRAFFVCYFTFQIKIGGSFYIEAASTPFRVVWLLFPTLVIFFGHLPHPPFCCSGILILAEKKPSIPG
jgi:hypothetical protein